MSDNVEQLMRACGLSQWSLISVVEMGGVVYTRATEGDSPAASTLVRVGDSQVLFVCKKTETTGRTQAPATPWREKLDEVIARPTSRDIDNAQKALSKALEKKGCDNFKPYYNPTEIRLRAQFGATVRQFIATSHHRVSKWSEGDQLNLVLYLIPRSCQSLIRDWSDKIQQGVGNVGELLRAVCDPDNHHHAINDHCVAYIMLLTTTTKLRKNEEVIDFLDETRPILYDARELWDSDCKVTASVLSIQVSNWIDSQLPKRITIRSIYQQKKIQCQNAVISPLELIDCVREITTLHSAGQIGAHDDEDAEDRPRNRAQHVRQIEEDTSGAVNDEDTGIIVDPEDAESFSEHLDHTYAVLTGVPHQPNSG